MPYNPNVHHRRSIRLKGYDYSQEGLYFVTICCLDRICRFGEIVDGKMILNEMGKIIDEQWKNIPNHFHAIVEITVGAGEPRPNGIGECCWVF